MRFTYRPTLGQVFLAAFAGLILAGSILSYRLFAGWQRSILEGSEQLRQDGARRVEALVGASLQEAGRCVTDLERQIRAGVASTDGGGVLEPALLAQLISRPNLAEVTFTRAAEGPGRGPWQLSVVRLEGDDGVRIVTRTTTLEGGRFVARERARPPGVELLRAGPLAPIAGPIDDPTTHPTFRVPADQANRGDLVWTDLHYTQLDDNRPEPQRRVVVTVMKAVEAPDGGLLGVLRVGLGTGRLDQAVRGIRVDESDAADPHRVFVCDLDGRLITRLSPADRVQEQPDEALRMVPLSPPPEVAASLRAPALGELRSGRARWSGSVQVGPRRFLLTLAALPGTRDWAVGIVAPEDHYLAGLRRARARVAAESALVLALLLALGAVVLRAVRGGLGRIVESTEGMRRFEFAAGDAGSGFRDVGQVMDGLERSKTALRAMSRYVPVDLVRHLYGSGREPVLGGEPCEVSLMFSDIEDFTRLAERLPPGELAQVLGRYLQAMTEAVHATEGVVDKFIGDAVMAIWNAPRPCPDHATRACRAALACGEASRRLGFNTRIGLHRDTVMVGHFGAPDRMSYTALGDGVNLASRLEGLNKQYGTTILASETVRETAQGFAFRLLDLVAVKGKTKAVRVFELLGQAEGVAPERLRAARSYEEGFAAYLARRFDDALAALDRCPDDAAARALAERCRRLREQPPPPEWDGVYVATVK